MIHAVVLLALTGVVLYVIAAIAGWVMSLFGVSPDDERFIPENGVRRDAEIIKRNIEKGTQ